MVVHTGKVIPKRMATAGVPGMSIALILAAGSPGRRDSASQVEMPKPLPGASIVKIVADDEGKLITGRMAVVGSGKNDCERAG